MQISTLTLPQQIIVRRLREGWTILADGPEFMTEWYTPQGGRTWSACNHSSLKAMEKRGVVIWRDGQWTLTDQIKTEDSTHAN